MVFALMLEVSTPRGVSNLQTVAAQAAADVPLTTFDAEKTNALEGLCRQQQGQVQMFSLSESETKTDQVDLKHTDVIMLFMRLLW